MARPRLPFIDINQFQGLYTKSNPEVLQPVQQRVLQNADLYRVYGACAKLRGNKRLLASTYTEGGVPKPISWVGFYKYPNLTGVMQRHTLIQAGTTIQRVESGGSLTELATGKRESLIRTTDQFDQYMLVTGQDPTLVGNKDLDTGGKLLKYDGTTLGEVGVTPPGREETVFEAFDNASGFSVTDDPTATATLADESTVTWDGDSVEVTKTTVADYAEFGRTYSPVLSFNSTILNRVRLYVYIPRSEFVSLSTNKASPALSVWFTNQAHYPVNTGSDDYYRFDFQIGRLVEGWNILNFDFRDAPTGDFGGSNGSFNPSSVQTIAIRVRSNNTSDTPVLYFDRFHELDQGTPTVSANSSVTVLEDFDATNIGGSADWVINESGTNVLSVDTSESAPVTEGPSSTNSLKLNKQAQTTNELYIENDDAIPSPHDLTDAVSGVATLWVYIPSPSNLNNGAAVKVRLGNWDGGGNHSYNEYEFPRTSVGDGWNELSIDLNNPDSVVQAAVDLSAVDYIRVTFVFRSQNTQEDNYRVDELRKETTGNLTGTVSYKVTYENRWGVESNAGPASEFVTVPVGGGTMSLTDLPVSPDPGVIRRHIYRTPAGGAAWLFLTTIEDNDNLTTTYTDNTADGSLGQLTPPEAGDSDGVDNSQPPRAGIVKVWKRTVFLAGDPLNPHLLYFSRNDNFEAFPLLNAFELDSRITGIFDTFLGLIVTTETDYWRVLGDNPDYVVEKVVQGMGAVGPRAVGVARVIGWAVDQDGMRIYDLRDSLKASEPIRDIYETIDKSTINDVHTVHLRRLNTILQFFPSGEILQYQYVLDEVREGWWSRIVLHPSLTFSILDSAEVEDSSGVFHLYVGADDGQLYEFLAEDSLNWMDRDGTEYSITLHLRSPFLRLGELGRDTQPGQEKPRPRYLQLRTREATQQDTQWDLLVETAWGSDDDLPAIGSCSRTVTIDGQEGEYDCPLDCQAATYARIDIQNSQKDVDVVLYGLRLRTHIEPRGGARE